MPTTNFLLDQLEIGSSLRLQHYRGRYAPSPTGPLHLGNLRTALISWLRARLNQGPWLLRIDDLDIPRNKLGAVEAIEDDLQWLGLNWDGPIIFQSKRRGLYRLGLSFLKRQNKLYACRCSRKMVNNDLTLRGKRYIYPGTCRGLEFSWGWHQGRLPSLRLKVKKEFANECGDIILRRSDGIIAYHLATVIDDLTMGITEVIRGEDLKSTLPAQLALIRELNQPSLLYKHVPVVLDSKGNKLSKRIASEGTNALRNNGVEASQVIGSFASSLGLIPLGSELSARELLQELIIKNDRLVNILS